MSMSSSQPWWKFGHVWLVIAGPLVVVVAGFVTLYLAIRSPDPVIGGAGSGSGKASVQAAPQVGPATEANSLAPAMQARNHAATGIPVTTKP